MLGFTLYRPGGALRDRQTFIQILNQILGRFDADGDTNNPRTAASRDFLFIIHLGMGG
jgi:hypothetical protein